jgi:GntR family transcriptional repressor for pyruvate dehydrogenase complex
METEVREYQKAIEYLCELVRVGELKIGSKLPTERKIAETLSIGRNSTREALRILENMGVVSCRQGSGNYITGDMTKTISGVIEMMLLLKQTTAEEVIVFRRDMEKAVCRAIIERGSIKRWQEEIWELLSADINTRSLEAQIEADRKFHCMLIQATENQLWICISQAIVAIYRNWIDCVLRNADFDTKRQLQESHMALLRALQDGSQELCEQTVDRHYNLVDAKLREIAKAGA